MEHNIYWGNHSTSPSSSHVILMTSLPDRCYSLLCKYETQIRCINNLHVVLNAGVATQIQPYPTLDFMLLNTIFSCLSQLTGLPSLFEWSACICPIFTTESNGNFTINPKPWLFQQKPLGNRLALGCPFLPRALEGTGSAASLLLQKHPNTA